MKRLLTILAFMLCVIWMLPGVRAVDLSQRGMLTLKLEYNGTALSGIDISVCRVATASEVSGQVVYALTSQFSDSGVVIPPNAYMTAETNGNLAKTIDQHATSRGVSRSTQQSNATGTVTFLNLEPGCYLVAQANATTAQYIAAPFLVSIPFYSIDGWIYDVTAYPKTEKKTSPPRPSSSPSPSPSRSPSPSPSRSPSPSPSPSRSPSPSLSPAPAPSPLPAPSPSQAPPPASPTPTSVENKEHLPQTGMPRWPIPVLSVSGVLSIALGGHIIRKGKKAQ